MADEPSVLASEEFALSDSGKLLLLFGAADKRKVVIEEDDVDPYAFLLNARGALPFGYSFRFEPLPFSPALRDDLYMLLQARFVSPASSIAITRTGRAWIEDQAGKVHSLQEVLQRAGEELALYKSWDRHQLFDAIYGTLTKGR
jgi:hypothetical protein